MMFRSRAKGHSSGRRRVTSIYYTRRFVSIPIVVVMAGSGEQHSCLSAHDDVAEAEVNDF